MVRDATALLGVTLPVRSVDTGATRTTTADAGAPQEFRVLNPTYLTEHGRSLSGFVNIVTKSGSNRAIRSAY